jgi:hypothetical protein
MANVEPVEKVNLARIRRVGRKCNLSGCSVCDDLMLGMGEEDPENHPLIVLRGFFYRLVRQTGKDEDQTPRSSKGLGTPWPPC